MSVVGSMSSKDMYYILPLTEELYHHGIKGQKWGIRRYQNADGTLTEAGRKRQKNRVVSDKEAIVKKGSTVYRVSTSEKNDTSTGKIYVTTSKETRDHYVNTLGSNKIYETGKAYAHEYIAKTDLKLPDKKTMEKIELGLLDDKNVQKELVDSLMKKGMSREEATKQVTPYNAGKAFVGKIGNITLGGAVGTIYGGVAGAYASVFNPAGAAIGAIGGAAIGAATLGSAPSNERTRALNVARTSYGDKDNKTINDALVKRLSEKGYNAMKDYNDRRAFGDKGKEAIIVFNSNKNLKNSKVYEIKSKDYGRAYARDYLKDHPNSKLDFNDLVKDGEAKYKRLYESGLIAREREKENKRILEEAEKNS